MKPTQLPKIVLLPKKELPIKLSHPWVFPKAIDEKKSDKLLSLNQNSMVQIYSSSEEFLGLGVYNPHSLYRIRVLLQENPAFDFNSEQELIKHIFSLKINDAKNLRKAIALPNQKTDSYRLFNSESDGLSGMTIDSYAEKYLVIMSYASWVEYYKETIQIVLQEIFPDFLLIWLPQHKALNQDKAIIAPPTSPFSQNCRIQLNEIYYDFPLYTTQKSGVFLDQCSNHIRFGELARGKRVLDLCCYMGGFSFQAAKNGAVKVVGIDSSAMAIEHAAKNFSINKDRLECQDVEFVCDKLENSFHRVSEFDLISIDPPKIIPSKKNMHAGENYYKFIHTEIFKQAKSGTLVMSSNCSSAMSLDNFCTLIDYCGKKASKKIVFLSTSGANLDHPWVNVFKEGVYLHNVLFYIKQN